MSDQWVDITADILSLSKKLKLLQVVKVEDVSLETTMHSHQINDDKIDPKFDINNTHTISYLLEHKLVRMPSELSLKECKIIYAQVLKLQALVLQTYPLPQTIYTLSYLYDQRIYADNKIIEALIESIHCAGSYIYNMHKQSCSIKEDDIGVSTFSYKRNPKTNDEVIDMLIKVEKSLENDNKKQKNEQVKRDYRELLGYLKVRRFIHLLNKSLGFFFQKKNQSKIVVDLQSLSKRINELEQLISTNPQCNNEKVQHVFFDYVCKPIRSHFGPRSIPKITILQALQQFKNGIKQFELLLPVPSKISDFRYKIQLLATFPINLWSKSYIKINLFHKQDYLFSAIRTEDALLNDINEWNPLKDYVKNDEKFINLIKPAAPVISQSLYRLIGRSSRWFWQCSKIYQDFNVLIHMSNQIDKNADANHQKGVSVCSYFYNYVIQLMIKQVLWGIQEDLYEFVEYHYVFAHLEYLLTVCDKNSELFLARLDKTLIQSYNENTLTNKKKKKMSEYAKRVFADILFKKGLRYYIRSFYRALIVLINREYVADPFKDTLQTRIQQRFRIFKSILFTKALNYQDFKKEVQAIRADQKKYLDEAQELLKESKRIFSLFKQFQEGETFINQREDAESLCTMSVKCSLVVMGLKLNLQGKKYWIQKTHPRYPQLCSK